MQKRLIPALAAALLSSGLFVVVYGLGLGFIFMFLPSLPLFCIGLSRHSRLTYAAIAIAALIIALLMGWMAGLFFVFFLGLPSWYLATQSLLWRPSADGQTRAWFSIGIIVTHLVIYACAVMALAILFYSGEPGGLPHLLSQNIHEAFADLQNEYGDLVDTLAGPLSFLIFSITIWMWGLALYGHAWLANRALASKNMQIRPDFAIREFHMPGWMLGLLAICGLASLIGSEQMCFLGKAAMISLMMPYFLLGAALLQTASKTWPSRRFFLFFIYFMVFTQFWVALILSAAGIWHQIKHLSGGKSWSKS